MKILAEGERIDIIHKLYFLPLRIPKPFESEKIEANFSNEKRMLTVTIPIRRIQDTQPVEVSEQNDGETIPRLSGPQIEIVCEELYDIL